MKRFERPRAKATDILSALMLVVAALLAGGYGLLTAQNQPVPSIQQSSLGDAGTGGHRSAPAVLKQHLVTVEARDAKMASWDDGKPKAFLASTNADLSAIAFGESRSPHGESALVGPSAAFFDARAPPAKT